MPNYQTLSTFFNRDTTLARLVNAIWDSLNPEYIKEAWLTNFFNIDTATGVWLDYWGTIVALPRAIKMPSEDWLGFYNSPFKPFNTFPFWDGSPEQNTIMMTDNVYRQAIKAKALANRSGRSVDDILAILAVIDTTAIVQDNRDMTMQIIATAPADFRLLIYTDALRLRPSAVGVNIAIIDSGETYKTYSIFKSASSVQEGKTVYFSVKTTGVTDGTVLHWKVVLNPTSSADFLHDSGTISIYNNKSSFAVKVLRDELVESGEFFRVQLRESDANGAIVAVSGIINIVDVPVSEPTFPDDANSYRIFVDPAKVTHGDNIAIIARTPDAAADTLLYYTILDITTNGLEHFTSVSGSIDIANHAGLVVDGTVPNSIGNIDKLYQVQLRQDSISGLILATSQPCSVHNPANTTPYAPPTIVAPSSCIEGETITISVNIGSATATTATWQVNEGTTQGLADLSALSGSFAIANKTGSFTIDILESIPIETVAEFFSVKVSINGQFLISSDSIHILPPSFYITNTSPITEGAAVGFAIETTNFIGSSIYWSVEHVTTNNADLSPLSGTVSLTDGNGLFTLNIIDDFKTEGVESFKINLSKTNGGAVIYSSEFGILDTSSSNITINSLSVDEGGSIGFTVNVTGTPPTVIYYTILDITTSGTDDLDSISGSINMTGNSGFLLLSAIEDFLTEGVETFRVQFRKDSIAGAIFHTTEVITINDTSIYIAPPNAIKSNFAAYNSTTQKVVIFNELDKVTYELSSNNLSYLGNINTSGISMPQYAGVGLQTEDLGLGSKVPAIVYRYPQNCSIVVLDTQANTYTENGIVGAEWCDLVYLNGYYYVCNYGFPNPVRKINATTFVRVADSVNIPQQNTNIKVYDGKLWVLTTANSGTGGLFHIRRINPDTLVIEQDYTYNPSLAYLHPHQTSCEIVGTKMYFIAMDINNQANYYLYSFDFVTGVFTVVVTAGTFDKIPIVSNGIYLYASTSTGLAKFDTTINTIVSTQTTDYSIPIGKTPHGIIAVHKTTMNMSTSLLPF